MQVSWNRTDQEDEEGLRYAFDIVQAPGISKERVIIVRREDLHIDCVKWIHSHFPYRSSDALPFTDNDVTILTSSTRAHRLDG